MTIAVFLKGREDPIEIDTDQVPQWENKGWAASGGPSFALQVKDADGRLLAEFQSSEIQGWSFGRDEA
jgi:hypothetical protein